MALPRVAIIGGGPGGLTLARLLQLQQTPFRLFELDESPHARSQGGTLDIHRGTGQRALTEAGLFSEFQKHARRDGAAFKILGKNGSVAWADDGVEHSDDRPEIDREVLRMILLNSLDKGAIAWGKKVICISEDATSTKESPSFNLQFEDGSVEEGFDLIVGADGAWSRVRGLLTDEKPFYSGITCVEARIDDIDARHPDLAQCVGTGSCFQLGDSKGILSQRNGDGSVRTYVMVRVEEDWAATCGINSKNDEMAKTEILERLFGDWDGLGKQLVSRSDGPLVVRPLYMLPIHMKWETRPGVTMIGDAAHLMTPFAGVGVNLALTDALDLSHAIRSHLEEKINWHTALRDFEEKMLARAHVGAERTSGNLKVMFSGDDADAIAKKFGELMGAGEHKGD